MPYDYRRRRSMPILSCEGGGGGRASSPCAVIVWLMLSASAILGIAFFFSSSPASTVSMPSPGSRLARNSISASAAEPGDADYPAGEDDKLYVHPWRDPDDNSTWVLGVSKENLAREGQRAKQKRTPCRQTMQWREKRRQ